MRIAAPRIGSGLASSDTVDQLPMMAFSQLRHFESKLGSQPAAHSFSMAPVGFGQLRALPTQQHRLVRRDQRGQLVDNLERTELGELRCVELLVLLA